MAKKSSAGTSRSPKGAPLAAAGDEDTIEFSVSWNESTVEAVLDSLTYDTRPVTPNPKVKGRGSLSATFTFSPRDEHAFRWVLLFPGKTLHGLKAVAKVNEGDEIDLGSSDEEKQRWAGDGPSE